MWLFRDFDKYKIITEKQFQSELLLIYFLLVSRLLQKNLSSRLRSFNALKQVKY